MADQFTTWMLEGEDPLDVSEMAWASFGMWWDDVWGGMSPPVRPRTLRFHAKRPLVKLHVRLKKKESVTDE